MSISSWIILPGPHAITRIFIRESQKGIRHTERRQCEDQGRAWDNEATSQRMQTATRSWRDKNQILPQSLWREYSLVDTLTADFASRALGK